MTKELRHEGGSGGKAAPPGESLDFGFDYVPAEDVPEVGIPEDARLRVQEKIESVDQARLDAAEQGGAMYGGEE